MAVERSDYEESRKQRVAENKRRMQELGIMELSKDLSGAKQKNVARRPLKRKSEESGAESRRSSRVAAKPAVSYKDQLDLLPGMRARVGTRERAGLERRYVSDLARRAAFEAAEEAFKDIQNPGFVKAMLHSHVSSCFWLGLPNRFCQEHMPAQDATFALEDDKGEEWPCLYLAHKTGMSGGWRGFSLDHELVDGDSCIFELASPLRFKVHFFRCEEEEVDEEQAVVAVADKDTKSGKKKAGRKPSKSSKKSKVEDGEDDDGDAYAPKVSKADADTNVAGPLRASRRKFVKKEEESGKQNGKEPDDLVELESEGDEDEDNDAPKAAVVTKMNQGGSRTVSSGRTTRNSLRRSLP